MRFKVGAIALILCLATVAQANGAMGLGLEMWDLRYWSAYVVVIIALEAWLIGRWLKLSWIKSAVISIVANAVTGGLGAASGIFAVFLHISLVGSAINPNPLMNAIALLTLFALPSAWVESIVWRWAAKTEDIWPFVKHVLIIHLITVPVGLAILLIPERPYRGLENTSYYNRQSQIRPISEALEIYIAEHESLPASTDPQGIVDELEPYLDYRHKRDVVFAFYRAKYGRFSLGESWSDPIGVNEEIAGMNLKRGFEEEWVWYLPPDFEQGEWSRGIAVELNQGHVERTRTLPGQEPD